MDTTTTTNNHHIDKYDDINNEEISLINIKNRVNEIFVKNGWRTQRQSNSHVIYIYMNNDKRIQYPFHQFTIIYNDEQFYNSYNLTINKIIKHPIEIIVPMSSRENFYTKKFLISDNDENTVIDMYNYIKTNLNNINKNDKK